MHVSVALVIAPYRSAVVLVWRSFLEKVSDFGGILKLCTASSTMGGGDVIHGLEAAQQAVHVDFNGYSIVLLRDVTAGGLLTHACYSC